MFKKGVCPDIRNEKFFFKELIFIVWISLDMGCVKTPCSAEPQGVFDAL